MASIDTRTTLQILSEIFGCEPKQVKRNEQFVGEVSFNGQIIDYGLLKKLDEIRLSKIDERAGKMADLIKGGLSNDHVDVAEASLIRRRKFDL